MYSGHSDPFTMAYCSALLAICRPESRASPRSENLPTKPTYSHYERFLAYRAEDDFVGMDMARKFLQMGYTRARRYANHASGRKYENDRPDEVREQEPDAVGNEKAKAARIFYEKCVLARDDPYYAERRREWVRRERSGERPTG